MLFHLSYRESRDRFIIEQVIELLHHESPDGGQQLDLDDPPAPVRVRPSTRSIVRTISQRQHELEPAITVTAVTTRAGLTRPGVVRVPLPLVVGDHIVPFVGAGGRRRPRSTCATPRRIVEFVDVTPSWSDGADDGTHPSPT